MLLERGDAEQVRELVHRLESSTVGAQVVDFSPKTQLTTTVVGTASVEKHREESARAGVELGGGYYGLTTAKASGNLDRQRREDAKYSELPALDLLTASGTLGRGRGVYFKLKPSPRTTLEGANEFHIVLRVPRAWRAGFLYVASEAAGRQSTSLGRGRFVVALYQQGDVAAQRAAQRYAQAELELRRAASAHAGALERRINPSLFHRIGVTRDDALAKDWLELTIFRGAGEELLRQLPDELRPAAESIGAARASINDLNRLATAP
jgi:hypothetical protein